MTNNITQSELIQEQNNKTAHLIRAVHDKNNPYVMLNKQAMRDPNLSLEAVGLWARILCHRDDWTIHVTQLMQANKCGKEKMYRMLNELIAHGYAYCHRDRQKGKYGGTTWFIFESQMLKEDIQKMFPRLGKPDTAKPDLANPPLMNKETSILKVDIDIKKKDEELLPSKKTTSSLSDAKKKKPKPDSFKPTQPIERAESHTHYAQYFEHFNAPLVGISDKDHEDLVAKHGELRVSQAYDALADWKISKAESDPKALKGHTDIGRIKNWVMNQVIKSAPGATSGYKRTGKLAIAADRKIERPEDRPKVWEADEFDQLCAQKLAQMEEESKSKGIKK